MAYAQGKHALGVCDRCGWAYKYLQLRMEWTGFKVCPESLHQPRPEVSLPQSQLGAIITTSPTFTTSAGVNVGALPATTVDPIGSDFSADGATGSIGTVTVVTT
jgi:hypothetical protein